MTATIVSVFVALACTWVLARAFAAGAGPALLDHPNERSLHSVPTPRTGGLAIVTGIVVGHIVLVSFGPPLPSLVVIAGGAALVLCVSVLDDVRHVAPGLRILVHVVAAAGLTLGGLGLDRLVLPGMEVSLPAPVAWLFTVLFVVWMTNLYNFMDGMDGFAAGMAVIGFGAYGTLAGLSGHPGLAASAVVIAAASGGFLALNFPPARIFMGDAGSSVLGFLAAAIALHADGDGAFPLWLSVLVFSPFIVDATVTLVRRAVAGERVWEAHRVHFYQRLVRLGWGHRGTTLREYLLMLACAVSAVVLLDATAPRQVLTICAWSGIYVMLMVYVTALERRKRRHETHTSSQPPA